MICIRRRQNIEISTTHGTPTCHILNREEALREMEAEGRVDGLGSFYQQSKYRNPLDLSVYSDGSRNEAGNLRAGYSVYRGSQDITSQKITLGRNAVVFDTEVIEALERLRAAYFQMLSRYAANVAICLDNQEAAIRSYSGLLTLSSGNQIQEIQISPRCLA